MDELRQRILDVLRVRGVSQRQASLGAGLHGGAVNKLLTERGTPSYETCVALATYFGWDVAEVLRLAGHEPRGLVVGVADPLAEVGRALSLGNTWPAEAQQALLVLARLTMRGA